jgi:hypothetical protein
MDKVDGLDIVNTWALWWLVGGDKREVLLKHDQTYSELPVENLSLS